MSIEVIVGLPHLREGPVIRRARAMQVPVLVSANAFSRWSRKQGWPEWQGWRLDSLRNGAGLASLALDSAGFVAMNRYRGFPWSVEDYLALAASYPFRWFASMDYCTEPEIAPDRAAVLDRLSRTIRVNRGCWRRARDLGIADRFVPVLQGHYPTDYERCAESLAPLFDAAPLVGVGSMCRRQMGGPNGVIAVLAHLDRILPPSVRLHGFGIKGIALTRLRGLEHRIASVDSQAWGIAARRDAWRRGIAKTEAFAADHMERWITRQTARLRARAMPIEAELAFRPDDRPPPGTWDRAVAQARHQIRDLIEAGELDHDTITEGWIEAWAAELHDPAGDQQNRTGGAHVDAGWA